MKVSKIALAMGLSMALVSGFANAADSGTTPPANTAAEGGHGHGTVHFKGEIIDAPCSISPESADQTVDLGQVANSALKDKGTSSPVAFNIKLQNCDISTYKTVTATWSGTPDVNMPEAWGITGTASGAAIVLRDASEKEITLGQDTAPTTLIADDTTIAMSAFLKGDGEAIVPGAFTGAADFVLSYQ
ncbi:TPA: type 1 fimbrial protein [Shigella flexneri]|nr:type 1 fimbrial protein [Shigella flexneri]HAY5257651.1 type 1 fimbrial protein [Shigella flexneri]HAY5317995.1 type 1 fimbrial protein [Shigella flexneri]HAY5325838.1 type 1 fimbrial protein [Shigella flexneri]HAY7415199.1 type 1 fimbrial protein [Shigella flexneri]